MLDDRPLGNISTLLTHTLLHAGWGHVLMNSGFILAFGIITIRGVKSKDISRYLAQGSSWVGYFSCYLLDRRGCGWARDSGRNG